MARLFKRDWKVTIGTGGTNAIETTELYIDFTVEKSLDNEPNSASVTVYNLSPEHRKAIEALSLYDKEKKKRQKSKSTKKPAEGRIRVELEAGYDGARSLIFRGDLRRATSIRTSGTWATQIEGEDGGNTYLASRISQAFPAGTNRFAVAKACAEAMGLGLGNLTSVAGSLGSIYSHGTIAHGWAAAELKGVLRSSGVKYSIQNGVLHVEQPARSGVPALHISPESGLVGTPTIGPDGLVTFTTLLLPNIAPGQYVSIESEAVTGTLKIYRVTYDGSSNGQSWYAKCECLAPDSPLARVGPITVVE